MGGEKSLVRLQILLLEVREERLVGCGVVEGEGAVVVGVSVDLDVSLA